MCRIEVSGFVTIMVVLLVTVMVTTEGPHHGISADLPKIGHPIPMLRANREDALKIVIFRDGTIYFGHQRIFAAAELPAKIQEGLRRGAEKKVYISADARVRYRTVLEVLDGVGSAGVENIAFVAGERKP
jgi:biopolymer transport protein TolR